MAFDFILGSTGTNWSRGIKQLLPDTPDSTSMGGQQPMPSPPQSPGEDSEAYWAKLQRDMENIRQNVWRGSYPMVLDAGSVANMLTSPELTSEQMAVRKMGFSRLLNSGKVILSDGGRRVRLTDTHASIITSPAGRLDRSSGMNDDELAVARDGGSSELASLARVRGCTMTMGLSPSQMAAQQKAIARRNLAIKQSIAKANAARAAAPDGTDDASPQSSSSSSKSSKPDPDGDDDQDAPDKPSKSREPNDDEQEVAMDGGACERAALARIRGRY